MGDRKFLAFHCIGLRLRQLLSRRQSIAAALSDRSARRFGARRRLSQNVTSAEPMNWQVSNPNMPPILAQALARDERIGGTLEPTFTQPADISQTRHHVAITIGVAIFADMAAYRSVSTSGTWMETSRA